MTKSRYPQGTDFKRPETNRGDSDLNDSEGSASRSAGHAMKGWGWVISGSYSQTKPHEKNVFSPSRTCQEGRVWSWIQQQISTTWNPCVWPLREGTEGGTELVSVNWEGCVFGKHGGDNVMFNSSRRTGISCWGRERTHAQKRVTTNCNTTNWNTANWNTQTETRQTETHKLKHDHWNTTNWKN